jgi:hypothetical protein
MLSEDSNPLTAADLSISIIIKHSKERICKSCLTSSLIQILNFRSIARLLRSHSFARVIDIQDVGTSGTAVLNSFLPVIVILGVLLVVEVRDVLRLLT